MFQSLSGFRVRCNRVIARIILIRSTSFNPYRVFEYVATINGNRWKSGIKRFQSLSGFRVRCNNFCAVVSAGVLDKFQSLSGFRVRCNIDDVTWKEELNLVSIPIGFSSTLQQYTIYHYSGNGISFNPYRVFEYVATQS